MKIPSTRHRLPAHLPVLITKTKTRNAKPRTESAPPSSAIHHAHALYLSTTGETALDQPSPLHAGAGQTGRRVVARVGTSPLLLLDGDLHRLPLPTRKRQEVHNSPEFRSTPPHLKRSASSDPTSSPPPQTKCIDAVPILGAGSFLR